MTVRHFQEEKDSPPLGCWRRAFIEKTRGEESPGIIIFSIIIIIIIIITFYDN